MRAKLPTNQPDHIGKAVSYQFFGKAEDRQGRSLPEAQAERVAWVQGHGIAAGDADGMTATLEAHHLEALKDWTGRRPGNPLVHFSISFDPKEADRATPEKQQEIAGQIIERMGLSGHVGFVIGHKDEPHPHMHFVFHRVHPETGKTWEAWARPKENELDLPTGKDGLVGSKVRLNHHTRELAREHGFNISREMDLGQARGAEAEYWEASRQGRRAYAPMDAERRKQAREETLGVFETAESWDMLREGLKAKGYRLGLVGNGVKQTLALYSDDEKANLSAVFGKQKDIRHNVLSVRFGLSYADHAAENGLEAPENALEAGDRGKAAQADQNASEAVVQLRDAIERRDLWERQARHRRQEQAAAARDAKAAAGLVSEIARQEAYAAAARADVSEIIADVYANPAEAAKAFGKYSRKRAEATRAARKAFEPERLGAMKGPLARAAKQKKITKANRLLADMKRAADRYGAIRDKLEYQKRTADLLRENSARMKAKAQARLSRSLARTGRSPEENLSAADMAVDALKAHVSKKDILRSKDLSKQEKGKLIGSLKERERGGQDQGLAYAYDMDD